MLLHTFICSRKWKHSCHLVYCDNCFITVVWNWTHNISEVCLYLLMDTWMASTFWLVMLLWTWVCKYLFNIPFSVLLDLYPQMGLLDCIAWWNFLTLVIVVSYSHRNVLSEIKSLTNHRLSFLPCDWVAAMLLTGPNHDHCCHSLLSPQLWLCCFCPLFLCFIVCQPLL